MGRGLAGLANPLAGRCGPGVCAGLGKRAAGAKRWKWNGAGCGRVVGGAAAKEHLLVSGARIKSACEAANWVKRTMVATGVCKCATAFPSLSLSLSV